MLEDLLLFIQILILLGGINLAPALNAYFRGSKEIAALDKGHILKDAQPLLGPGKTWRGLLWALLAGPVLAWILGLPLWLGLLCSILSMLGDLLTSFVKRRIGWSRGTDRFILDHFLESALPVIPLAIYLKLSILQVLLLLFVFCIAGWYWSKFYKQVLLQKPFVWYPRPLHPAVRLKELASCRENAGLWSTIFHFEDAIYYHLLLQTFFRCTGLYTRGQANALCFQIQEIEITLPELPPNFHGYTILFVCDLHLDGLPGLTERLLTVLDKTRADLCLMGGDYRMRTHGTYKSAMGHLQRVLQKLQPADGVFAVLGNHDCLEMVEVFYDAQVKVLINEACRIDKNQQSIWIVGVDDPHFFGCHNVQQAFQDVPEQAFSIFLAHSPVLYDEVRNYQANLYLAGHTHAGQIQIPRLGPVFTHCSAPRKFCSGFWTYQDLIGYTSPGVGVSGVPVRFHCPGEVTLITLFQGQKIINSKQRNYESKE